jgi:hypothetical protein
VPAGSSGRAGTVERVAVLRSARRRRCPAAAVGRAPARRRGRLHRGAAPGALPGRRLHAPGRPDQYAARRCRDRAGRGFLAAASRGADSAALVAGLSRPPSTWQERAPARPPGVAAAGTRPVTAPAAPRLALGAGRAAALLAVTRPLRVDARDLGGRGVRRSILLCTRPGLRCLLWLASVGGPRGIARRAVEAAAAAGLVAGAAPPRRLRRGPHEPLGARGREPLNRASSSSAADHVLRVGTTLRTSRDTAPPSSHSPRRRRRRARWRSGDRAGALLLRSGSTLPDGDPASPLASARRHFLNAAGLFRVSGTWRLG